MRSMRMAYAVGTVASTIAGFGALAATPAPVCANVAGEVRLQISVKNVSGPVGNITITLYPSDPDMFLARKGKIARIRIPAVAPVTSACLPAPRAGIYAIAIYHDENDDHDFQRTLFGLPNEGFGFSNDPATTFGLPRFENVRFEAKGGDTPVTITVHYPHD